MLVALIAGFVVEQWDEVPFDHRADPSSRWEKSFDEILNQFQVRVCLGTSREVQSASPTAVGRVPTPQASGQRLTGLAG
ncbi:hypothetical protein [Micromonospora sp. NPDC023737]|uniref:hypothetical protein n=1 Tax=unclassified Micromonospora TaxID=2617518 RepID=UPI0033C6AB17